MYNTWLQRNPDSKIHGAYMGPTWGWHDPGGSHVGPMILAIWEHITKTVCTLYKVAIYWELSHKLLSEIPIAKRALYKQNA